MNGKKLFTKFTLIFAMLVSVLTLFCISINEVKADTNSTELKSLKVYSNIDGDYNEILNPKFSSDQNNYTLTIPSNENSLTILTTTYDKTASVIIRGNNDLINGGIITITVKKSGYENNVYTINVTKNERPSYTAESIIDWTQKYDLPNGEYNIVVTGTVNGTTMETKTYPVELINYYDDVTYSANTNLGNSLNQTKKMLIVKYHKNLTINSGVTLTVTRCLNYTYYKGLYIHVIGKLTNNGTISMTARGTYNLAGENVYLYKNSETSFEYIPAVGGAGGIGVSMAVGNNGGAGSTVSKRALGGGGSGASNGTSAKKGGNGSAATSYSGGSGGGGVYHTSVAGTYEGGAGEANGGAGGAGSARTGSSSYPTYASGGAGNPGGNSGWVASSGNALGNVATQAENGTGGLLVIYANDFANNGTISSNGSSVNGARYSSANRYSGGGGSGAGSINVFTPKLTSTGTFSVAGGTSKLSSTTGITYYRLGASGGAGTSNITEITYDDEYLKPTLLNLEIDGEQLDPEFDSETNEYYMNLDSEKSYINISAVLSNDDNMIVTGDGEVSIPTGEYVHNITLISKIGVINTYTIHFSRNNSTYSYLRAIRVNDINIENFNPTTLNYEISLPYNDLDTLTFDVEKGRESQTVIGDGQVGKLLSGSNTYEIKVTDEENLHTITYTVTVNVEHTSKLKSLNVREYEMDLNPEFDPDIYEYNITILSNDIEIVIDADAYDDEATIKVEENQFVRNSEGTVTIIVSEPNSPDSIYHVNYLKTTNSKIKNTYSYTGNYQTFIAPYSGNYRIQLWGAQGGASLEDNVVSTARPGAYGAYTSGYIHLTKNQVLYIYVGQKGTNGKKSTIVTGGYNGGGRGDYDHSDDEGAGAGGGATDIRLVSGTWNNFESLKSRIMVAAGGGGMSWVDAWGYGGGLSSDAAGVSPGVSQTTGNAFGVGQDGVYSNTNTTVGGGGGGYYGGYAKNGTSTQTAGSGGSSFISGHEGSNAITKTSISGAITHTGQSIHYSGMYFKNTTMIDGAGYNWTTTKGTLVKQPNTAGTATQVGQTGNGYAIIEENDLSRDNYLLELETDYGSFDKDFDPQNLEYTLTLNAYDQHFTLSGTLSDITSIVSGLEEYKIEEGETKIIDIVVTSTSGDIRTYKIKVLRPAISDEHTSKLKTLIIKDHEIDINPEFQPLVTEYSLIMLPSEIDLNIIAEAFDDKATITITGNEYMIDTDNIISIKVSAPTVADTIYTINVQKLEETTASKYNYTGNYQTFIAPVSGQYKIQTWGASGGNGRQHWSTIIAAGKGAYTSGYIYLPKGQKLYIYVGNNGVQSGTSNKFAGGAGGYNGGATGGADANQDDAPEPGGGGGGATDIRLVSGTWNDFESLKSRIMIAAGGAGGSWNPGEPGGLYYNNTNGYQFGVGQVGYSATIGSGGGGGGYWGGYSVQSDGGTTYGGTSYVSGCENCKSISETSTSSNITLTDDTVHYSGLEFKKIVMLNGNQSMPTTNGLSTETGHSGSGYAIIEPTDLSKDNYLTTLITDKGTLSPSYDPLVENYTLTLGVNDTKLKINARPSDDGATIEGLGEFDVPAGTTDYQVSVTAESGDVRIYTIKVTRPASTEARAKNITITGLVENICSGYMGYCELDTSFDPDKNVYYMSVPSGIRELEFTVDKMHDYQQVVGAGVTRLSGEDNTVTIEITSEDGNNQSIYTFEIYRDMTGDNYIDELIVKDPVRDEEINIGFNYLITEYSFKVENDVTYLDLSVKLDDENATYQIMGNTNFKVGNNVVIIEVQAANLEVRDYVLNVYRVSNSNTLLQSLEVVNGTTSYTLSPEFKDITTSYAVTVDNEVTSVEIKATAQASTTTIDGTGVKQLKTGINTFKVTTLAENGDIENYTIMINREKNDNTYLSSLSVSEGNISPSFDKNINEYELTVNPYTKKLTITAIPEVSETSNVSIKGNSNFKIGENTVTITVTAENGETRDYIITVAKEGSDNNYLSSLIVNQGSLSPTFDKETTGYNVDLPNNITTITVAGEKEDSLSTVTGFGTYRLSTGLNEIPVVVTSETGIPRQYTIRVYRAYNSDPYLSNIRLSNGTLSPTFDKETLEYTVNVENSISSITLTGVPNVSTTTVNGNGTYNLSVGENNFELVTTAEDGVSTMTYKVKVVRDVSSNANLSYLLVREGRLSPSFDKMTINYRVVVPNTVNRVTIDALPEDSSATAVINNTDLVLGENQINVTVRAQDNSEKVYYITVVKEDFNADLKSLQVSHCNIDFDPNNQYYECEVVNEIETVEVTAESLNETNTVSGTGTKSLEVGRNVISVILTTPQGYEKVYNVLVTRKQSTETRLSNIIVEDHALNETYDKDRNNYTLTTKENNLSVSYTKMHPNQTVSISGNTNLTLGTNTIVLHVISEDNVHSQDYTITVTKQENDNNYLRSLIVDGHSITPTFNKGIMDYYLTVENEELSVIVKAEAEEITSTVNGNAMYGLVKGENIIPITVTAEDLSTRTYYVHVTRLGSRNANLASLGVVGHTINPEFNKNTTSYTLTVPYNENIVTITATPEEENAAIDGIGEVSLVRGVNTKNIIVTSDNGDTKIYKIIITRSDPVTSLLENIQVRNYELDSVFESNKFSYTVVIDNEVTSLEFIISKLDPNSTYEIIGNQDFDVGPNEVKIISTSSDGQETSEYVINVIRQAYSNTFLSSLSVSEGTLTPAFEKTTLTYTVDVENNINKITIGASPENASSTVTGTGEKDLSVGENKFAVKVTTPTGISRTYFVIVNRTGSSNAGVLSISSTIGIIEKQSETVYKLTVPNTVTEITKDNILVVTADQMATVEKDDKIDLSEERMYKIMVTSPDGTNQIQYIINVVYELSANNKLKNLTSSIGTLSPVFDKNTNNYTIQVDEDEEEIEFVATLDNENATLLNENLLFGLTNYTTPTTINIQAEDGTLNTYIINVVKSLTRNRNLKNIEITGIEEIETDYEFNETTYNYNLSVPYDINQIGFEITKNHPRQTVKIYKQGIEVNEYDLDVGENEFVVEVTNTYGESLTYTYNIERLKNTNNYLKSLKLTSPEVEIQDFDKEIYEYDVSVPYNYENITIEAIPEDTENATVTTRGTTYLIDGQVNDVQVRVKAQNGDVRTYYLHVLRLPEHNNLLKALTISSGDIYELTPKFTSGITDYTLEVPSTIELVNVIGLPLDEDASVEGNGDYNLDVGLNKIQLKVIKDSSEKIYTINITRKADKNVYLSKLEISNGELVEVFSKTRETYTVNIPYTEDVLQMTVAPEDPNATVQIYGNNNLRYGSNEIKIKVTSSDTTVSKTYTLNVIKAGNVNNNLATLSIDGELVEGFDPNTTHYTYVVENNKDNVLVEAIAAEETSSVTGIGYHTLTEGENTINVYVTSQSGLIKTYTITVTRKKNAYLSMLVTDRGDISPTFNKNTFNYTLEVENEIEDVTVIGIKDSNDAIVAGNGKYNLVVGNNPIQINVSNDGNENTYTITVTRKGSINTYLKYLTVAEGILDPEFDKTTQEYEVHIPNDKTKLTLSYEPENSTSVVEEIGNENITEDEKQIILRVRSTSGETRDYTINVIKEDESYFSNKLLELTVDKGTLSPRFDPDVNEYTVSVGSAVSQITVNVVRKSKEATVDGVGIHKLNAGRNVIPVTVTSKDGKQRVYTLLVYKYASNDARIEKLEFNEGYLSPAFNKNVYNYTLVIDSESPLATVKTLQMVDPSATYEITGSSVATTGNVLRIVTTSQDGTSTKTYKITMRVEKSSNAYLASLSTNIGTLTPEFNKTKNTYEVNVENNVNNIFVNAQAESSKANVIGTGKHDLSYGNNYVNIIVTSEAGTTNTYSINVIRAYSANANLKDLYVRGYNISPTFDEDTISYTLEVENEIDKVEIGAEVDDELSTVTGTGVKDLSVGENPFNVVVTAQNGDIKTYTLTITRKKIISSKIESLEVKEGLLSPSFMSDFEYYSVSIPNEYTSITPIIKLVDEEATYEIIGNENLQVGNNEVQIKVTSEEDETIYYLTVIRNVSTNNYLASLSVNHGQLSPAFEKTTGYYEVEVENDIDKITVEATAESSTTSIRGVGEYTLNLGENLIVIQTRSASGITRAYQVKVIRASNENNYLRSLTPSVGVLSPEFSKTTTSYTINVPEGTSEITLTAEKDDETSEVMGDGLHTIKSGENNINIIVTSQGGSVRTYSVKVTRGLSNNTNITSIIPSDGTLSPEYNDEINEYNITVGKDTNILDFDITLESANAKVTGHKAISIDQNSKKQIITVTAEDGTVREIEINITKEALITDITLSETNVIVIKGDTYQIIPSAVPEGSSNNFVYTPEDAQIVSVDNTGLVTGLKVGSTKVTVTTPDNPLIEKEMQITVLHDKIESNDYEVRDSEERIVIGAEIETTIREFKLNLLNNSDTINIYDKEGNIVDDDDIVKTGLIIKLEYNDKQYDEAVMVVRGDVDGDGYVNVTDYITVLNHALEVEDIVDYAKFAAADVEEDELINVTDYIKIMDYSLENLDTLN